THTDTIRKIFLNGDLELTFTDDATNPLLWTGSWLTTDEDFVSGPTSYTDSPYSDYSSNVASTFDLQEQIDLENAEIALLTFQAKWDIEANYDYAMVMASTDNVNFFPLCGQYTKPGSNFQIDDAPLYDGSQLEWVAETVDLADYIGEKIWIRFGMFSDGFVQGDGFYVDDIEIEVFNGVSTSTTEEERIVNRLTTFPNPFGEQLYVNLNLNQALINVELRLVNALGQLVLQQDHAELAAGQHQMIFDQQVEEGFYFLQLYADEVELGSSKVVKLK
ncbi:MAG: T9SS type A sorting domain-containing protein, partial [Bacteroidota bacterium]